MAWLGAGGDVLIGLGLVIAIGGYFDRRRLKVTRGPLAVAGSFGMNLFYWGLILKVLALWLG